MANNRSSKKRVRKTQTQRLHNRYFYRTTRNAVKALRETTDKAAAVAMLPKVVAMLDKLAHKGIIHANKAANLKSSLQLMVNGIA